MTLNGLPKIDPLDAEARGELLAALNGCAVDGGVLRAKIATALPDGLAWFACRNGAAFAPEMLRGTPLRLAAAETAAAMDVLEGLEPILRAVETALGIELEPEGLDHALPSDIARMLRLTVGQELVLHLTLPRDLAVTPVSAPFVPDMLGHIPVPVALTLTGPRLSPVEAADLARGDLVLLGPGPLAATLDVPGEARVPGRFDPAALLFLPKHIPVPAAQERPAAPPEVEPANDALLQEQIP